MRITASKDSPSTPVGLQLWSPPNRDRTIIVRLEHECIFPRSALKRGMHIVRVNDTNCLGKKAHQVSQLLREIHGSVSIMVASDHATRPTPKAIQTPLKEAFFDCTFLDDSDNTDQTSSSSSALIDRKEDDGQSSSSDTVVSTDEDDDSTTTDEIDYGYEEHIPSYGRSLRRRKRIGAPR